MRYHSHRLPNLESQVANISFYAKLKAVLTVQLSNMLPTEYTTGEMCDKFAFRILAKQNFLEFSIGNVQYHNKQKWEY